MAFIFTPRQLAQRGELYHQLSQLVDAGIGLIQALDTLRRNPPSGSFRIPLSRLVEKLESGSSFSEAIRSVHGWLPTFDAALLEAGERSGRMPQSFRQLAQYYTERCLVARQVLSDLAYPIFLFHFAIFIGPVPDLVLSGNLSGYLAKTLSVLVPLYVVVAVMMFAAQGRHGEAWRAFVESLIRWVPLLGPARRSLALSRLASALEALINAGVPILEAWDLSASASGSPALRRTVVSWKPLFVSGSTPGEVLRSASDFPEMFTNTYNTGEVSGKLDDSLLRLQRYYQEQGTRQLKTFTQWFPKMIYLAIAFMIAYRVVSFYAGYFNQIGNAIGG